MFARYVTLCNELSLKVNPGGETVELADLEFIHCSVLSGADTAEAAALMKGDSITVRPNHEEDRKVEQERQRIQRESDKLFIEQMRGWFQRNRDGDLPFCPALGYELVVLDCRSVSAEPPSSESSALVSDLSLPASELRSSGSSSASSKKRKRNHGQQQHQHLKREHKNQPTQLMCHGPLVSRRCPWLGELIRQARIERDKKLQQRQREQPQHLPPARGDDPDGIENGQQDPQLPPDCHGGQPDVVLVDDEPPQDNPGGNIQAADDVAVVRADDDANRDRDRQPPFPPAPQGHLVQQIDSDEFWDAKMLEDDDDDFDDGSVAADGGANRAVSGDEPPRLPAEATGAVVVTLRYPKDAVKLLLEYLYTNRAVDLGHDAFVTACRTKPTHIQGPVPPFSVGTSTSRRRWPNRGEPAVLYATAVALVKLALEAGLPRLALMAEVAASQLVTSANIVEALSFCHETRSELGRDLDRLRKATMSVILRPASHSTQGSVWVYPSFRHELKEKRHVLVPTLLSGTMEALLDAAASAPAAAAASPHHHSGSSGKSHHHAISHHQQQRYKRLQEQFVRYDPEEWRTSVFRGFKYLDRLDKLKREEERKKRRLELHRREGDSLASIGGGADPSDDFDSDAAVMDAQPPPRRKSRRAAAAAAAAALDTSGQHNAGKRVTFGAGAAAAAGGGGGRNRGGERASRRRHL